MQPRLTILVSFFWYREKNSEKQSIFYFQKYRLVVIKIISNNFRKINSIRVSESCRRIKARPLSTSPLLQYSSTPVLQYSSTPVLQYSSTPVLQYSSTSVLQYSSTPVLQYSSTSVLQYFSTIQTRGHR